MKPVRGTTPPGAVGEHEAARWVQTMFAEVAPKYDFLNHLLSFNIDRGWRKALMRRLRPVLERPDGRVLDLCCGTGDVLIELQSVSRTAVMGADFCHPMLVAAKRKIQQKGFEPWLFEADALRLPFPDESLDAISIAFGFRNLANYEAGLHELYRVLRGRGVLALLEFSHPRGAFMKTAYGFYAGVVLPAIGTIVSGSREAYTYLPDSIRKFPQAAELRDMMTEAGFADTSYELLTGGIAALHVGTKASH